MTLTQSLSLSLNPNSNPNPNPNSNPNPNPALTPALPLTRATSLATPAERALLLPQVLGVLASYAIGYSHG